MTVVKTINLGRIRPVHRGAWLQTNSYAFLDFVTSEGSTYICIKPDGVPSGIYLVDDIYWAPLATKGANATLVPATLEEVNLRISSTKPITPATLQKAKAGGVASLNASGKVPSTQLPMATDTVRVHVQTQFDREKELNEQIDTATTAEELSLISW